MMRVLARIPTPAGPRTQVMRYTSPEAIVAMRQSVEAQGGELYVGDGVEMKPLKKEGDNP